MEFDLVISNPPYGKIGANITKDIIDYIDYDEFINLLPALDYVKNSTGDLYNYQSEMISINNGFEDAAVTTHLARIHKKKVNTLNKNSFIRSTYTDKDLDKYFEVNSERKHYAIDSFTHSQTADVNTAIVIGHRDINHKHMPYGTKVLSYKWNKEASITIETMIVETSNDNFYCTFYTPEEKKNFAEFMYSDEGFRFLSKVFTAMNVDSSFAGNLAFPKVDWSKSWTVKDILTEYGYAEEAINKIIQDLNKFKGLKG